MSDTSPEAAELGIQQQVDEAIAELGNTSSTNKLTHMGWLIEGLDLWYRTNGKRGHSKDQAQHYVISSVAHLLAQSHSRIRAEVLEARIDELKLAGQHLSF